jgi:hypothetical protein
MEEESNATLAVTEAKWFTKARVDKSRDTTGWAAHVRRPDFGSLQFQCRVGKQRKFGRRKGERR